MSKKHDLQIFDRAVLGWTTQKPFFRDKTLEDFTWLFLIFRNGQKLVQHHRTVKTEKVVKDGPFAVGKRHSFWTKRSTPFQSAELLSINYIDLHMIQFFYRWQLSPSTFTSSDVCFLANFSTPPRSTRASTWISTSLCSRFFRYVKITHADCISLCFLSAQRRNTTCGPYFGTNLTGRSSSSAAPIETIQLTGERQNTRLLFRCRTNRHPIAFTKLFTRTDESSRNIRCPIRFML